MDRLLWSPWERGGSPDPQGFSGFTPSSPFAKVSNRLHLKEPAKREFPYFFLRLQRGNSTSIYLFYYLQNPLPAPMPKPEEKLFGIPHGDRCVKEEPEAQAKDQPYENQAQYRPRGSALSHQTLQLLAIFKVME